MTLMKRKKWRLHTLDDGAFLTCMIMDACLGMDQDASRPFEIVHVKVYDEETEFLAHLR